MIFGKDSSASRQRHRAFNTSRRRHIPLLEPVESRLLLSAPVGSVAVLNRTQVSGWAFDPDTPATSITVQIKIDGIANNVTASNVRNDLTPIIGSADHGFSFSMPSLSPGNHSVIVSAADSTSGQLTVLKSAILTNPAPIGAAGTINATTVAGWAFDSDEGTGAVSVRIDNNGSTVNTISASNPRSDLTAVVGSPNHGFSLTGSFGIVDVYAIDVPSGQAVLIGSNSVKASGSVGVLTSSEVKGWAWTPDLGSAPMTIEVDVDGASFQTATADTARPDLVGITGSANHGFDFTLSALPPGSHVVQVYALDSVSTSNAKILLGSTTLTNTAPTGSIAANATSTSVSGWAFDANAGASPISVQVKVDGVLNTTVTANMARPDLTAVVGSPDHGFTASLTGLTAGPHKIQIYGVDNPSGTATLIATKYIDNTLPIGSVGTVNSFTITGWAYDADSPTTPVNVIVVMDGTAYPATAASVSRPDLSAVTGGNIDHGFSITTPTHLAGAHAVAVFAVDTFTGQEVVLGTKAFINHAPVGSAGTLTSTSLTGWAFDADDPTASLSVLLQVDGDITGQVTANVARPDLTPILGSANHGYHFTFTALSAGTHTLNVFAVDPATGVSTLIGTKFITI